MFPVVFAAFAILAMPLARSAPTAALDSATLLQNGLAAQALNAQFATLKVTDPCTSGEVACIGQSAAQCSTNGTWETQRCSSGKQCFALPSVRQNGTIITCTSEADALSTIAATGAQGGLTSNSTIVSNPPSNNTEGNSPPTSVGNEAAAGTVTVTVTLGPGSTLSLAPVTRTLAPAEASSLLASLTASNPTASSSSLPSSVEVPPAATSSTSSASASGGESGPALIANTAAPATILLTNSASPTASVNSAAIGTPAAVDLANAAAPTTILLTSSPSPTVASGLAESASTSPTISTSDSEYYL